MKFPPFKEAVLKKKTPPPMVLFFLSFFKMARREPDDTAVVSRPKKSALRESLRQGNEQCKKKKECLSFSF